MAAPRPKKKKAVVKKKTDVKSPAETRKSISRKQVGTSRPARGDLGARAQYLKYGPTQPQGPEAPRYREKIGPVKPNAADPKRPIFRREGGRLLMRKDAGSVLLKRTITKIPVVGAAAGFIADAAPAGEGSTKDKYSTLKKKYSSAIGPKKPKASVSPTTGAGRPEYPSSNKGKKASGNTSGVGGPGGAKALTDVKSRKSGTSKAASVVASSSSSGTSKAAKAGVGRQTKYQRNETAMEQRKRSSSKPKKSIFSLFRKG